MALPRRTAAAPGAKMPPDGSSRNRHWRFVGNADRLWRLAHGRVHTVGGNHPEAGIHAASQTIHGQLQAGVAQFAGKQLPVLAPVVAVEDGVMERVLVRVAALPRQFLGFARIPGCSFYWLR